MLAAALLSLLFGNGQPFISLGPDPRDAQRIGSVEWAQWFEATSDVLHSVLFHPEAGLSAQAYEALLDVVCFGAGSVFSDRVPGQGLRFTCRPLGEVFLDEDAYGQVDTVFRSFRMTARQAWGLWEEKAGRSVNQALRDHRENQKFQFVQAILHEKDARRYNYSAGFPVASYYLAADDRKIIEESGYSEWPCATPRWSKDAGEKYGRAPGVNAVPDALMTNRMKITMLVNAERNASPPVLVADEGVIGPHSTAPNGVNVVRALPGGMEPISYLTNNSRVDVSDEQLRDTRDAIRSKFHYDLMNSQLDPRMSISQLMEMTSRMTRRIGPMIQRLQSELVEPLVSRAFAYSVREGLLPPAPGDIDVSEIQVDYVSPAAKALRSSDVQAVLGTVQAAVEWSQVDRDVTDNIDFDRALRAVAKAYGGYVNILRSQKDVDGLRKAKNELMMQQAALQAQQQAQAQAGAGAGNINPGQAAQPAAGVPTA